jgi:hypothetical protein
MPEMTRVSLLSSDLRCGMGSTKPGENGRPGVLRTFALVVLLAAQVFPLTTSVLILASALISDPCAPGEPTCGHDVPWHVAGGVMLLTTLTALCLTSIRRIRINTKLIILLANVMVAAIAIWVGN